MAPSNKRIIINERKNNGGGSSEVASNGSNLLCLCFVPGKKVCRYCKREFKSGRALGGHIRLHYKDIRERNIVKQASAAPSTVTNTRRNTGDRKERDAHDDVIDLSKSLSGFGWRGQKKRVGAHEGNNKRNKVLEPVSLCYDDDDDDSCFDDDDNEDDSYKMLREKLKGYGSAHKICRTRRLYRCKVCDVAFPTIHAVLCHVNEYSTTTENEDDGHGHGAKGKVEERKEKRKGKGKRKGVMREDGSISIEVDQVVVAGGKKVVAEGVSTSVPPKMVEFDLNEMPTEEEN